MTPLLKMRVPICRRNFSVLLIVFLLISIGLVYHMVVKETERLQRIKDSHRTVLLKSHVITSKLQREVKIPTKDEPQTTVKVLRSTVLSTTTTKTVLTTTPNRKEIHTDLPKTTFSTKGLHPNGSKSPVVSTNRVPSNESLNTNPSNDILPTNAKSKGSSSNGTKSNATLTTKTSFPNVTTVPTPHVQTTTELPKDIGKLFDPILNEKEKDGLRKALKAFHECMKLNITYFMYAGTLLGSYRHHGYTPWDKDIDLLVDMENKVVLKKYLESLKPEFELETKLGEVWRLSHVESRQKVSSYRWPYADVFFYKQNATHLWASIAEEVNIKYEKKDIFPLIERPFMGMMLSAPRNTAKILKVKFNIDRCKNNRFERGDMISRKKVIEISCEGLRRRYPFVKRTNLNETHVHEALESWTNGAWVLSNNTYILPR